MKENIIALALGCLFLLAFYSCLQDEILLKSTFNTNDSLDENASTYTFDTWLRASYLDIYNLDFRYKLEDVGADMNYNLVPVSTAKAEEMAKLIKFLWFDAYAAVAGPDFLKQNGPRIIHLIGSPAYNPVSGTVVLGTAEGGIKVTIYRCNELDVTNIDMLNEYYFKTMHHEFAHILHQKRNYPTEFGMFSIGKYNPLGWQNKTDSEAASMGFVSPYASGQVREDFVEIIANYLVKSDTDWNNILTMASKNGLNAKGIELPDDDIDGRTLILRKLEMASNWLKNSWNIDLEKLRSEIMEREKTIYANI
jgi:substrate import-associated zinc metallohydrolase lipoprotein